MNENIQALLQKIAESEELQSRFAQAGTPEEAYEIAKEIQGGFTKEEFLEAAKALAEAADEDIGDEDLASAAGGINDPDANRLHESLTINVSRITDVHDTVNKTVIKPDVTKSAATKSILTRSAESKATKALTI